MDSLKIRTKYPPNIQKQLGWLIFFLAFPVLNIGVNFTFYIFIYILYNVNALIKFGKPIIIKDFTDKTISIFILWALFCSIIQPKFPRNPGFFLDFKFNIQHIYWLVLFIFIKNNFQRFDLKVIGKYAFWGFIFLFLTYTYLSGTLSLGIATLNTKMGRNAFVYQTECIIPLIFMFYKKENFRTNLIISFILFVIVLLTNGRAGTLIVFLFLLFFLVFENVIKLRTLFLSSIVVFSFSILGIFSSNAISKGVASAIEPFNSRIANLLLQEDDGDLDFDRSWIERQIHIKKGLEIFKIYPFTGVGLNHFMFYDTDYSTVNLDDYIVGNNSRVSEATLERFNQRSAHNSYIQLLAETGFIGLGLYLLFLFPMFKFFPKLLSKHHFELKDILVIAVVLVSIHNWAISSYSSAITFALFGFGYGRMIEITSKSRF